MTTAPTYSKAGVKSSVAQKLDKDIFGLEVSNHQLIKDVYVASMAAKRDNFARTKTRGEVRGGGKKPWRQKGTGRARFGSSRVPIWRGGGITFGPTGTENYSKKVSKSMKKLALKQALSVCNDKVVVVDELSAKQGKTSEIAKFVKKLGLGDSNILLVVSKKDDLLVRAVKNIPSVSITQAVQLNTRSVLDANHLVFEKDSLKILSDRLAAEVA